MAALAGGDTLRVTLASLKTVVFKATVRDDGNITLPLIDVVPVGGLRRDQAAGMVRSAYLAAGIYDTRLKVTVVPDAPADPVLQESK
ncbi:MAG: polysaccharide biosynthesis/export family protein [Verrucomicrobia bacterium]|nr:polysaccharide biosynthesis/export family protein [Verrucomicrobiota bacterium]MDA1086487.1 polysaccharide biosynthesis/export family protein [Verrucomicrobiota bacterium]